MTNTNVADEIRAIIDLLDYIECDVEQYEPSAAIDLRRASARLKVRILRPPAANGAVAEQNSGASTDSKLYATLFENMR